MIYQRLGRTGLKVSRLGLGSGGHTAFGQRIGMPEADVHRLVHRALDLGINYFDTAPPPVYLDSELILQRALKDVPRDRYLLSTKVTLVKDAAGTLATPREIIQSVENSLRRLDVSEIDLLLVGGFVSDETYRRIATDLLPTLHDLKQAGKVRYLGATEKSNMDGAHAWLTRVLQDDLVDAVMVAYNVMNQSAEREVFHLCRQNDVGTIIIYSVRNVFSRPDRLREVIAELKQQGLLAAEAVPDEAPLDWLLDEDVGSLVEAAYRFVSGHEAVSTIMTGTLNPHHLEQNVQTIQQPPLSAEKIERLRQLFGHIAEPIGN